MSNMMIRRAPRTGLRSVRGASLIEVLVSILLAAIGLLALSGANVASIRYSKMAQYRGTATLLSTDLAERMRANKAGLAGYAYGSAFAAQATAIPVDTSCETYTAAACTAAALAAYDMTTWRRLVRNQLPEGSVFVVIPAGQLATDVWIAWRDPAVANPDENSTDARNYARECPAGLSLGADKGVRCSYFRINL
jgi:type IV pilus assembly protein PilV